MTHFVGFYHVWQSDDSRAVVWLIEFLTVAGLICAVVAVARLLTAPSGFDRPIEARIDGWLAGLAAANVASELLLFPVLNRAYLNSAQSAAFFAIQLILISMIAMTACGVVWQAGPEAKASFACLLGATVIQVATFQWNAVDLKQELIGGTTNPYGGVRIWIDRRRDMVRRASPAASIRRRELGAELADAQHRRAWSLRADSARHRDADRV